MTRILVIEDDQMLRKIYERVLIKEGYEVDMATDGIEGLKKALENEPDLIVLDMMMPNMNGLEFLRSYDVINAHPKVKVIGFSNTEAPQWINQARALGAVKYMTKYSFSPKAMLGLIKDTLEGVE